MRIDGLKEIVVAVSISENPDLEEHGLSKHHLRVAMGEFALYILSSGMNLAYGGDLRNKGFVDLLLELIARYHRYGVPTGRARATNYFAWPVHIRMHLEELNNLHSEYGGPVEFVLLNRDGGRLNTQDRPKLVPPELSDDDWTNGLTAMRKMMCNETDARIVLGGRVEGYKGCMPRIAEEALMSLRAGQALFLLGGFGGCARDISKTLGLIESSKEDKASDWTGRINFENFTVDDLNNGLDLEENQVLAQTPFVDQAVALFLHGLRQLRTQYNQ